MKVDELQRYDLDLNGMVVPCEGGRFISASEAKAIEDERDKALEYKEAYHEKVLMLENDIALAWEERDRLKAELAEEKERRMETVAMCAQLQDVIAGLLGELASKRLILDSRWKVIQELDAQDYLDWLYEHINKDALKTEVKE